MLAETCATNSFRNIEINFLKLNHQQQVLETICSLCGRFIEDWDMSTIPYGSFMVQKIREKDRELAKIELCENQPSEKLFLRYPLQLTPMKYSSKLMNSIWGMYNRYSVHNLKKIMDDEQIFTVGNQQMPSVVSNVEKCSGCMESKNKSSAPPSFIPSAIWLSPENYY